MKIIKVVTLILFAAIILSACSDDTNFSVDEHQIGDIDIKCGDKNIRLRCDTSWYISDNDGRRLYSCDEHKMSTFFNVLRDIQVMGLCPLEHLGSFDAEVSLKKHSGSVVKTLRLNAVQGAPQMIGCVDDGKCYVVGVPGLKVSPICNFVADVEYWKDLSLLELSPYNITKISVENYIDTLQSFFVSLLDDGSYVATDNNGVRINDIDEQNIRLWLGSIAGKYRAVEYIDTLNVANKDIIYRLKISSRIGTEDSITFYKKFNGSNPDFNNMYFRKGNEIGIAKYYDFDKLFIDADRLKEFR